VATREGNTFRLETTGVRRLRVLVSPDEIDLERPLRVEVNGRVRFDGVVTPSAEVLLRWAARDEDRTMLFAAELSIEVATPN
jgi:predicted metalloprotease